MLLQLKKRALRRFEITTQEEQNRPAGGNGALHVAVEGAAGAGGVAVEIDWRMFTVVRRIDA
jgi:hypothetical protein